MSAAILEDAVALAGRIARGELSARRAVEVAFERLDRLDRRLNVFLAVDREGALRRAGELDARRAAGHASGPLHGVPIALKANMCFEGVESSCASKILAGYRAPYTATFVQRLLDAGANPIGMTNMDEFAMGSSSENSAFGPTKNPWDEARTPGGSSSGSAVAVAAGIVPIALGSDTGGSVRQPAALCGIHGFKPTYWRVSRYGLIAFGSSLDQVSPFARTVRDLELVTHVMSGTDVRDSTCLDEPALNLEDGDVRGLRVGVPREHFPESLPRDVRAVCEAALATLEKLGATIVPVSLPHSHLAIPTYYVVATAEASSNLARFDGVRYGTRVEGSGSLQSMYAATREEGFGPEVKRRILLGTYVLSAGYYDAWYGRALKVRSILRRDFETAFEDVDVIAGPTSPEAAFRLGAKSNDPVAMYLSDVLTVPVSLAGIPAISVPCGFVTVEGSRLPVGLQIVGPNRADARVLRVARAFEAATDFARALPPIHAGGAA
ncbi:MAG: Asp-tRNA(Asn)/Glu-tRNA(Gln) amidotransferase subunit GatA [Planctomycetota bacterium]|nr:Asp-tRNA(Asn)/Glu-tRNA(Gln) amidotransferase subunit GatA [Planctomycetota bacterium]